MGPARHQFLAAAERWMDGIAVGGQTPSVIPTTRRSFGVARSSTSVTHAAGAPLKLVKNVVGLGLRDWETLLGLRRNSPELV